MKNSTTIFSGGVPTEPDVKTLMDQYGEIGEGVTIPWEEISLAINVPCKSSRYRTVVNAWRKRMEKEKGMLLIAINGVGLEVASPSQRVTKAHGYYKQSLRRVKRSTDIADGTDRVRLTDIERRACDYYSKIGGVFRLAAATEQKKLPKAE